MLMSVFIKFKYKTPSTLIIVESAKISSILSSEIRTLMGQSLDGKLEHWNAQNLIFLTMMRT